MKELQAPPQNHLLCQQPPRYHRHGGELAASPPEGPDDPFDPGLIDSEEQPDLFPPDPHDVWALIRREARKVGDTDTLREFPVIVASDQEPRWKAISYSILQDLRCMVTDHGSGVLYTVSLIQSICDSSVFTLYDFKMMCRLIMTEK